MIIRIMKLAEEHGLVISEADDEYYTTYDTDSSQLDQFGKDIIDQCLRVLANVQKEVVSNTSDEYNEGRQMGLEVGKNMILKHFGIES
jgi:hypothetical protein